MERKKPVTEGIQVKPIEGTWFEFLHHQQDEGRLYNPALRSFTEEQWREKIREIE